MFADTSDWDDADEILRCFETDFVPCNACADAALEAHRIAWARYLKEPSEKHAKAAGYAVHVLTFAVPRTASEAEIFVDYVRQLPAEAWRLVRPDEKAVVERYREICMELGGDALRRLAN